MTMPHERTRALLWAREFLRDARAGKLTEEELKHQALVILRHYPDPSEIDHMAVTMQMEPSMWNPPMLGRVDIATGKAIDDFEIARLAPEPSPEPSAAEPAPDAPGT